MSELKIGSIVLYRPDKKSTQFHDRGHCPKLPGIVVKVWSSGAANLRVADVPVDGDKVDLKVFLDHNGKDSASYVWVFGATRGPGLDQWEYPKDVV